MAAIKYLFLIACLTTLSCCHSGERQASKTVDPVAEVTSINRDKVYNYSKPDLPAHFGNTSNLSGKSPYPAANDRVATLGRVLFYDLKLSTNNRASCASCHQQAFGFTDSLRFSNGISSAAVTDFHAMRLANLRYWQPGSMFWDRRVPSAEAQASIPIHSLVELGWGGSAGGIEALAAKMGATSYYPELFRWAFGAGGIKEARIQTALAQFVRAIISSSSRWDTGYARVYAASLPDRGLHADLPNFSRQENRGRRLFMGEAGEGGAGCASCHVPPTFALSANARSNGLDNDETRIFKAPSLRNVGLTGPYMHDGRFASLQDVIEFYDHGVQQGPALDVRLTSAGKPRRLHLSSGDKAALVAFLQTLSDFELIKDPRFSDPFRHSPAALARAN